MANKYVNKLIVGTEVKLDLSGDTNLASQRVALRNGMTPADTWTKRYRGVDMPHIRFVASRHQAP